MPETATHDTETIDLERVPPSGHQFDTMGEQLEATSFGMWVFLITEIMFFGGLFCGYTVYRSLYYDGFAVGSRLLEVQWGATNTAVLIASSLTMALAVRAAQTGRRKLLIFLLSCTLLLGFVFLSIKGLEYWHKWQHQLVPALNWNPAPEEIPTGVSQAHVELFICFYFLMTLLHALHMVVGIGVVSVMLLFAARRKFSQTYFSPVEVSGLYWHFVDIVWIFLFPLLYLLGGRYS
jgi:cytochrome c oxidase subunit III